MRFTTWKFYPLVLVQILLQESRVVNSQQQKFLAEYVPQNPRSSAAVQFVNQFRNSNVQRNGPVLFPSDSGPPPRTPLIVTSRPLPQRVDSASDNGQNRNQKGQSVDYGRTSPDYVDYSSNAAIRNLGQSISALHLVNLGLVATNDSARANFLDKHPYAAVAKKLKPLTPNHARKAYTSIEKQTVLPPIYSALDNYARTKVFNDKQKVNQQKQNQRLSKYYKSENSVTADGADDEYYSDNSGNEAKHYAFSYAVRDQHTGDDFSHSQRNTGSSTNGEYRVKLPDGRLQIVSYTADNGGYKAEVRYEDEHQVQAGHQIQEEQKVPDYRNEEEEQSKLGRIVVPSQEYHDYEDFNYYDDASREPPKEVLITSKPSYITHSSTTDSNLLYKQLVYHDKEGLKSTVYLISTPQPNSNQYYEQFVSTTPKYELVDNYLSTPAPNTVDIYDHLESPDVSLKSKGGQVKYTSIAPVLYNRAGQSTTPQPSRDFHENIDLRKYFAFAKR